MVEKHLLLLLLPLTASPQRNLTDYPFKRFAAARFQAELSAFQITGASAGTAGGGRRRRRRGGGGERNLAVRARGAAADMNPEVDDVPSERGGWGGREGSCSDFRTGEKKK